VMGVLAGSAVLASSATDFVAQLLITFCYVYMLLIFLYVISGMLPLPYTVWLARIQRFLYDVCEPYLRLFRRVLPPLGPLDLSPFVASLTLVIAANIVGQVF
jgi:YggT family protein